ncbi:hypothetical protein HK405_011122 [Cladochytrium tenue]|nr:hypothetical protein HK405_011122 [Cladochytrium tenue]
MQGGCVASDAAELPPPPSGACSFARRPAEVLAAGTGPGRESVEGEFSGWGSVTWIDNLDDDATRTTKSLADAASTFSDRGDFLVSVGGSATGLVGDGNQGPYSPPPFAHKERRIGEWLATAIAANDLVGSVLYTTGVTTAAAGKLAPVSLFLAAVSLFFFKRVIQDVMHVIPLNGSIYSVMILSTAKSVAAVAACCSILGFETSANYVEQMSPGVFAKTLRNMSFSRFPDGPTVASALMHFQWSWD